MNGASFFLQKLQKLAFSLFFATSEKESSSGKGATPKIPYP